MFIIGNIPIQYKKSTSAPLIKLVSTNSKKMHECTIRYLWWENCI